jgi:hypothetical protein
MNTFNLIAESGFIWCNEKLEESCRELADTLFPLNYTMVCNSPRNSHQLDSNFDKELIKKINKLKIQGNDLQLPTNLTKEYDAIIKTSIGQIVIEVEKANWERFLYDLLKAHIYLKHGADYCCIILPENWPHKLAVKNLFQESKKRLELAINYKSGNQSVFERIFLIGFSQIWNGNPLRKEGRDKMREECQRHFKKTEHQTN